MKSPFIIIQDFISPLTCEKIIEDIKVLTPNFDSEGEPKKLEKHNLAWEQEIIERFREQIPLIEEQYDCIYTGLEKPLFQHYPENAKVPAEQPGCENSQYIRRKWVMHKDVDLVGFIWLKDYNENVPLDPRHEVLGGKLEFPAFNFSLMPQRGSLVLFPAGPHFISVISPILLGDMYQIKLNVCISEKNESRWFYQPQKFPGTWKDWLSAYY
jgi:hypothetical protein